MKFLGTLIHGHVDLLPRQILIAYIPNTRHVGRPLKSNKETMWESLKPLFAPVQAIHIDFFGSMKDFYFDALDKAFWNKCVDHLRDPSLPVPERPNQDASYHPRRSARNRSGGDSTGHSSGHRSSSQQTDGGPTMRLTLRLIIHSQTGHQGTKAVSKVVSPPQDAVEEGSKPRSKISPTILRMLEE